MTPVSTPESVRGTRDLLGESLQQQHTITEHISRVLHQAGYDQVDLPVLEHRDLYLKKSGADLLSKLYHWSQGGRELALRPEWTASVLRLVISSLGESPLPIRLRYAGPVFRYERPRRATYRQFTQIGLELIGASGPRADAEVIGLAAQGLQAVGIQSWTLTISQIGVIKQLLQALGLAERTTSSLTWSLERIRSQGLTAVRDQFAAEHVDLPIDLAMLPELEDADIETLLLRVLPELGIHLEGGGRDPEAIVNRLVRKLRRTESAPQLERAWTLLESLSSAQGSPGEVLPLMASLLSQHGLPTTELDELATTLDLLEAYGLPADHIKLDFGMGRGLHYYTGMIFEIDGPDGLQLCGGGRYDDLVTALGGRAMAAVGMAYGLERVVAAAPPPAPLAQPAILVMAESADDYGPAIQAASYLKAQGYRTTLDLRGRPFAVNLTSARRRGLTHLAVVTASSLQIRSLETGQQHPVDWPIGASAAQGD